MLLPALIHMLAIHQVSSQHRMSCVKNGSCSSMRLDSTAVVSYS